jgi:hypothetical protein
MSSIDTKSDENGWSFSATEATMLDGDDQHVIRLFRYHDLTELGKVEIKKTSPHSMMAKGFSLHAMIVKSIASIKLEQFCGKKSFVATEMICSAR